MRQFGNRYARDVRILRVFTCGIVSVYPYVCLQRVFPQKDYWIKYILNVEYIDTLFKGKREKEGERISATLQRVPRMQPAPAAWVKFSTCGRTWINMEASLLYRIIYNPVMGPASI